MLISGFLKARRRPQISAQEARKGRRRVCGSSARGKARGQGALRYLLGAKVDGELAESLQPWRPVSGAKLETPRQMRVGNRCFPRALAENAYVLMNSLA
jgi:hypothetical protein